MTNKKLMKKIAPVVMSAAVAMTSMPYAVLASDFTDSGVLTDSTDFSVSEEFAAEDAQEEFTTEDVQDAFAAEAQQGEAYVLMNIPYDDLEGNVKLVWEKTQRVIREGLQIEKKNGKNYNNFPKASENPVCHVRPHARNAKDTYELPDGRQYPKQCFWLNNSYILSQLQDQFKEE